MGPESVAAAVERCAGLLVILVVRCGHCPALPTVCALMWTLCPLPDYLHPLQSLLGAWPGAEQIGPWQNPVCAAVGAC